ncbi:alkaline phosphatase D family protein [Saccharopolyspora sp. HNM0983]|uniref:Alkaline phosphatase D family protein n=1 Tax=Saccharopolyspora montiporae TaxID=2781240 RepID=A0A929G1V1_9PSEU|nr:alkaline phosphatase D family protein [Saccharopolyspora sp. HNM0983]MBE9375053.1 alkaline phosphatase D family protein [Saccharopolyspora sp. HNM0983]
MANTSGTGRTEPLRTGSLRNGPRQQALSRRSVLLGGAAVAGAALGGSLPACAQPAPGAATAGAGAADPFTLGVASGDPLPDGMVLWTRLAPEPTAEDGSGGMPARPVPVEWEVAADERFTRVVQRGTTTAAPEFGHSVHVETTGLRPGHEYFYRFRTASALSPAGRTRTAPHPGSAAELALCFASCSHYGEGHFTAYRHLAEEEPQLVLHLGDYQYEYAAEAGDVREVLGPETRTLAGYRQRYAQYRTDPDLQLAHATAPWMVVFDDHEVDNNWARGTPEEPEEDFLQRRAAAFRAYYENMPLRAASRPRGADMRLYRRLRWGSLINLHMLDTRQYRDDQPCGDEGEADCPERLDPDRTLLGTEQERWLLRGLGSSSARWDVLGQQVFFSRLDTDTDDSVEFSTDSWAAYVANRDRIARGLGGTRNGVVLTGDVHRHWAGEVHAAHEDTDSPRVATELVTSSISSGGDGDSDPNAEVLDHNPHLKYYANRRGYVRAEFTAEQVRADHRELPHVSTPGAPVRTGASFAVADGDPALHRV